MSKTLTLEEVKERFKKYGATMIDDVYINNSIKYTLQCEHGHIIKSTMNDYRRYGCTECNKLRKKEIPYTELKNAMSEIGYELLSPLEDFETKKTKMKYRCSKGHINMISYEKFMSGKRCPDCANNKQYTYDFVKTYIENEGYKLVSEEYKNVDGKLLIKCPKGHVFETSFYSFKNNSVRCYCERESKGEKAIREYFINNSIEFVSQKRFEDCRNIKTLPFDFYLKQYNLCIEYDGEQHFDEKHSYSKESFRQTQINDEIKNNYCEQKGITLVRIPYWEFKNIDNILANIIKNFND